MSLHDVHLLLWIPVICYSAAIQAHFQVFQAPENTNSRVGSNVTFYCTFPIFQDNSDVEVYWWKLGESKFLQRTSDSRNVFRFFKQGGGSFHLLNISSRDSGVYVCGVKTQGNSIVNGTGSTMKVFVPPTPLRILSKVPFLNSTLLDLICETNNFYPEAFILKWYKDGIEITIHPETTKELNIDGLYKVSSLLKSVQSGVVYTCQVSHVTLPFPANVTFIVPNLHQAGKDSAFNYSIMYGSTGGALIFLLLIIIIGSDCQRKKRKGMRENVENSVNREEIMEHSNADDGLTYATLDLNGTSKVRKLKPNDEDTEYAQLKAAVQTGSTEVDCAETSVA